MENIVKGSFAILLFVLSSTTMAVDNNHSEPISPIPEVTEFDPDKVALGERLFHDPRLSSDGSVSCASCHSLNSAGVDNLIFSVGVKGQLGSRNTPTVFNSS